MVAAAAEVAAAAVAVAAAGAAASEVAAAAAALRPHLTAISRHGSRHGARCARSSPPTPVTCTALTATTNASADACARSATRRVPTRATSGARAATSRSAVEAARARPLLRPPKMRATTSFSRGSRYLGGYSSIVSALPPSRTLSSIRTTRAGARGGGFPGLQWRAVERRTTVRPFPDHPRNNNPLPTPSDEPAQARLPWRPRCSQG